MKRQIFFCQVGGYDLHTGQTPGTGHDDHRRARQSAGGIEPVHVRVSARDGATGIVATMSPHSPPAILAARFPSNGAGQRSRLGQPSSHPGRRGATGGRTYGKFPTLAVNGPDDTSTGRWIPTTAIDQYFATLATWFGVDSGNLSTVFPNIGRFATPNLWLCMKQTSLAGLCGTLFADGSAVVFALRRDEFWKYPRRAKTLRSPKIRRRRT